MRVKASAIQLMFDEVSLGSPENAVGFVLWRLVARYQREADRALLPCGITNLQFTTLAMVAWCEHRQEPATQIALARFAGIQPMQLSQTLKALEAGRMVIRYRSPDDTRAKLVRITPLGLRTLRDAMPRLIAVQERLFGAAGKPGGRLLELLLRADGALPDEHS